MVDAGASTWERQLAHPHMNPHLDFLPRGVAPFALAVVCCVLSAFAFAQAPDAPSAPKPSAIGNAPISAASVVMMIGRNRFMLAS